MRITSYSARYYLEKPEHNCPSSFPAEPSIRLQYSGASWPKGQWKTDVESDLKNINRLGTRVKNNQVQYNPDNNRMNETALANAEDLTSTILPALSELQAGIAGLTLHTSPRRHLRHPLISSYLPVHSQRIIGSSNPVTRRLNAQFTRRNAKYRS